MKLPIAHEGYLFIKIFLGLSIVFWILGRAFHNRIFLMLAIFFFAVLLFTVFFFRNPERKTGTDSDLVFSPADGRIIEISEDNNIFVGRSKVIKIFLSIFDVHIQRSPVAGKINFIHYIPGKFLAASNTKAALENEQNWIGIEKKEGKVLVKQIAGLIARRISCWVKPEEEIVPGQRLGLIRFGSQVDLYLPNHWELLVKRGDKVKAGITVVAKIKFPL